MNSSNSGLIDATDHEFARQLVMQLKAGEADLPFEVSERLRAARGRAIQRRKVAFWPLSLQRLTAAAGQASSAGGELSGYWARFAGWLPVLVLLIGLFVIQSVQDDQRASELAEIDAALLIDDLPPAAYADPGFAHFLKTHTLQSP